MNDRGPLVDVRCEVSLRALSFRIARVHEYADGFVETADLRFVPVGDGDAVNAAVLEIASDCRRTADLEGIE